MIDVFCSKLKIHSMIFNTENYWFYISSILRLLLLLHLHITVSPFCFDNQNEQERANPCLLLLLVLLLFFLLSVFLPLSPPPLSLLISFLSTAVVSREALNHYCGFSFTTMCVLGVGMFILNSKLNIEKESREKQTSVAQPFWPSVPASSLWWKVALLVSVVMKYFCLSIPLNLRTSQHLYCEIYIPVLTYWK